MPSIFTGKSKSQRTIRHLSLSGLFVLSSAPVSAAADADLENRFPQCIEHLESQAIEAGVSSQTAGEVLAGAEYLERVIELDRRQPEFTTTFADYLNRRVNSDRVSRGRELLDQHEALLERVTR